MIVVTYFFLTQDPVKKLKSVVDVGYGIGGSSRYISRILVQMVVVLP